MKSKYKWVDPIPTKSGRSVMEIWNDLKLAWKEYKNGRMFDDEVKMVNNAVLVQKYEDDLGMTISIFPILTEFEKHKGIKVKA